MSGIDCKQVAESLLAFRDGALSEAETQELREHLHLCPPCEWILSSYDEVVEVLGRLRPIDMPEGLLARLKQRLAGGEPPDCGR